MKKNILIGFLIGAIALSVGCSSNSSTNDAIENTTENTTEETTESDLTENETYNELLLQYSEIQEGETVAIMKTNMGEIKLRFFPEQAPKAVENFLTHAENGYYDGITFHRVIENFVIQGGDPLGNGTGGESIWGEDFENEVTPELSHIYGALSMANAGPDTNGSQFFIVQAHEGATYLDGSYSIFGQVYEGMEVVEAIVKLETDYNDKPIEDVIIESIEVTEYSKE